MHLSLSASVLLFLLAGLNEACDHDYHEHHGHLRRSLKSAEATAGNDTIIALEAMFKPSCGAHQPSLGEMFEAGAVVENWKQENAKNGRKLLDIRYRIPVTFHVLMSDKGDGALSDSQLAEYLDSLNTAFRGSSFTFYLKGTNRQRKNYWHYCTYDSFFDAGKQLRVGGVADMNVYFCNIQDNTGGWAYFPEARGRYMDGIVIRSDYTKFGFPQGYVRRKALPHEAGYVKCQKKSFCYMMSTLTSCLSLMTQQTLVWTVPHVPGWM